MARLTFNYDTLLITGPLTDRKISRYIKDGRYGKDAQQKMLARDAERNKIHKARKEQEQERKKWMSLYD